MLGFRSLKNAITSLAEALSGLAATVREVNANARERLLLDEEEAHVVSARVVNLPPAESEEPETVANGKKGRKS